MKNGKYLEGNNIFIVLKIQENKKRLNIPEKFSRMFKNLIK